MNGSNDDARKPERDARPAPEASNRAQPDGGAREGQAAHGAGDAREPGRELARDDAHDAHQAHQAHDAHEPGRGDALDALLRAWHDEHRAAAESLRDRTLAALAEDRARPARVAGWIGFGRLLATAALIALAALLTTLVLRGNERPAFALGGIAEVAEGGALDALDDDGSVLGPCPLQHTDVNVEISGLFARTYVEQTYANPYPRAIEAVYTFPLPHGAAVDRMTMIVRGPSGEKVIEGEVKERALARAIYEEARESGYVASLLEQERPNVFTQSVANVEPGATVRIRIATIELARRKDGVAEYVFPLVVGPRYVPGAPASMPALPEGWRVRQGVVLRAPAGVEVAAGAPLAAPRILALLEQAVPIAPEAAERVDLLMQSGDLVAFTAKYANGSAERGTYSPATGIGELNGRFFLAPLAKDAGTGFASDTDAVPDASRITPMPVRPPERAGHDVSIRATIDSGGPEVESVESALHAVRVTRLAGGRRLVDLEERRAIPNRDFVLRWKVADAAIEPSFFAHVSESQDPSVAGGYFALVVEPPARVAPAEIRPRELVFVLDVSGSMNGFPIEKSKAVVRRAIAAMRPNDVFNVVTFAGATSVLWPEPRPASDENRRLADEFVNGAYGAGGTEMMAAIDAALVQPGRSGIAPARLLDLPADGRQVRVAVPFGALAAGGNGVAPSIDAGVGPDGSARRVALELPTAIPSNPKRLALIVEGAWQTKDGERVLVARSARFEDADARTRIVVFLTDGYIGNDQSVIAAVRDNARASRVFSFGIGNSVNRFLLEEMARAGRGACEVVTLAEEADPVVERLVRRIDAPVLTDVALEIPPELGVRDLLPAGEHLPDLYDAEPIVLLGRYDRPGTGTFILRGRTGAGPWEKRIAVELPKASGAHDVVPTLWARASVDALLLPRLAAVESQTLDLSTKQAVIRLGERYRIATPYTSFVAVEKNRVVVGGRPMLVAVPVELPEGTNWNGFFGEGARAADLVVASAGSTRFVGEVAARLEERLKARLEDGVGAGVEAGVAARFEDRPGARGDVQADLVVAGRSSGSGELSQGATPSLELGAEVSRGVESASKDRVEGTAGGVSGGTSDVSGDVSAAPSAGPKNAGAPAKARTAGAASAPTAPTAPSAPSAPSASPAPSAAPAAPNGPTGGGAAAAPNAGSAGPSDAGSSRPMTPPGGGREIATRDGSQRKVRGGAGFDRDADALERRRQTASPSGKPAGGVPLAGGFGGGGGAAAGEAAAPVVGAAAPAGGAASANRPASAVDPAARRDVATTYGFRAADGEDVSRAARETVERATGTTIDALDAATGAPSARPSETGAPSAAATIPLSDPTFRDRLVRVLDRRLVFIALAAFVGDKGDAQRLVVAFGLEETDGRLDLAVRVAAGEADRLAAELRRQGIDVDAVQAERDLLVLRASPVALAALAQVPGVRRVEPLVSSAVPETRAGGR